MLQQSKVTAVRIAGLFLLCNVLTSAWAETSSTTIDNSCCAVKVVAPGDWTEPGSGVAGTYIFLREETSPPLEVCDDGCVYENTDIVPSSTFCFGTKMKIFDPTGECNRTVSPAEALLESIPDSTFTQLAESLPDEDVDAVFEGFSALGKERLTNRQKRETNLTIAEKRIVVGETIKQAFKSGDCEEQRQVGDVLNEVLLNVTISDNSTCGDLTAEIIRFKKIIVGVVQEIVTTVAPSVTPSVTPAVTPSVTPAPTTTRSPPTTVVTTADEPTLEG